MVGWFLALMRARVTSFPPEASHRVRRAAVHVSGDAVSGRRGIASVEGRWQLGISDGGRKATQSARRVELPRWKGTREGGQCAAAHLLLDASSRCTCRPSAAAGVPGPAAQPAWRGSQRRGQRSVQSSAERQRVSGWRFWRVLAGCGRALAGAAAARWGSLGFARSRLTSVSRQLMK